MEDNKRKLYDALSQDYDLGSFEQFSKDIADDSKRRKLFDATSEEYDFGDYDTFSSQLGFEKAKPQVQPQVQTAPVQPETEEYTDLNFDDEPNGLKETQERERNQAVAEGRAMFDEMRQKKAQKKEESTSSLADAPRAVQQKYADEEAAIADFGKLSGELEGFNDRVAAFNEKSDLIRSGKAKPTQEEFNRMQKEGNELADIAKRYDTVMNSAPGLQYKAISDRMTALANGEKTADNLWEYTREYAKLQRNPLYRASMGENAPSEDEIIASLLQGQISYYEEKLKSAKGDEKKKLKKAFSDAKEALYANPWYKQHLEDKIAENKAGNVVVGEALSDRRNEIVAEWTEKNGKAPSAWDAQGFEQYVQGDPEMQRLYAAAHMRDDAIREYKTPTKYEQYDKNVLKGLKGWAADTDTWSFGIESFAEDISVVRPVLEKVEKIVGNLNPDNITDGMLDSLDEQLTAGERAVLDAYFEKVGAVAAKGADTAIGYQIGQGIGDMITLGLEMVATGGVGGAVRGAFEKGSKKALIKILGKRAYRKVAKSGAGKVALWAAAKVPADMVETAVRLPFMPSTYKALGEGAIEVDEGYKLRDLGEYAPEKMWDQYVEQLTEVSNGFAFPLMGKVVKTPGIQKLFKETVGENGMRALRSFIERGDIKLLDDAMIGSFGGEWEEELLGAVIHSITDDPKALSDFFSAEQQLVLLGTLAPLPVSRGVVGGVQLAVPSGVASYSWGRAQKELERLGFDEGRISRIKEVVDNASVPEGAREIMLAIWDAGEGRANAEEYGFSMAEDASGVLRGTIGEGIDSRAYGALARYFWAAQQKRAAGLMGEIQQDQKVEAKRAEIEQNIGASFTRPLDDREVVEVATIAAPDGSTRNVFVTSEDVNSNGELAYVAEDGSKGFLNPNEIMESRVTPVNEYLASLVMQDAQVQEVQGVVNDAASLNRQLRQQVESLPEVTYNGQVGTISRGSSSDEGAVFVPDEGENVMVSWEDLARENGIEVPDIVTPSEKTDIGAEAVVRRMAEQQQIADAFREEYSKSKKPNLFFDSDEGRVAVIDIIEDTIDPEAGTAQFVVRMPDGSRNVTMASSIETAIAGLREETAPAEEPAVEETPEEPAEEPVEETVEESPTIPVDKSGEKIYDAPGVSVEDALEDMYSTEGLSEEQVDQYILERAAEAEKGRNPKRGKMNLAEWGKATQEANRVADFWAQAKEYADANIAERKRIEEIEKELEKNEGFTKAELEPQTWDEALAAGLVGFFRGGGRLRLSSVLNLVGQDKMPDLRKGGYGFVLSKKSSAVPVDKFVLSVMDEYPGMFNGVDEQDATNMVGDLLMGHTRGELGEYILNNRKKARAEQERMAEVPEEPAPVVEPAPVPAPEPVVEEPAPEPVAEPEPEPEVAPAPEPEATEEEAPEETAEESENKPETASESGEKSVPSQESEKVPGSPAEIHNAADARAYFENLYGKGKKADAAVRVWELTHKSKPAKESGDGMSQMAMSLASESGLTDEEAAELVTLGTQLAEDYIVEDGFVKFPQFFKNLVETFGDGIRPFSKQIYLGASANVNDEIADQMDDRRAVRDFDTSIDLNDISDEQNGSTGVSEPGQTVSEPVPESPEGDVPEGEGEVSGADTGAGVEDDVAEGAGEAPEGGRLDDGGESVPGTDERGDGGNEGTGAKRGRGGRPRSGSRGGRTRGSNSVNTEPGEDSTRGLDPEKAAAEAEQKAYEAEKESIKDETDTNKLKSVKDELKSKISAIAEKFDISRAEMSGRLRAVIERLRELFSTNANKTEALAQEKVPYSAVSDPAGEHAIGSVVPSGSADAMRDAIRRLEAEEGKSVAEFVKDELGYKSLDDMFSSETKNEGLSSEQVDSVGLAIHQMKKGKMFIIGDMTGIGKGRQGAALIRWAKKNNKKCLFVTEKPDLFSDMYQDLKDIGTSDLLPFIVNSDAGANITEKNSDNPDDKTILVKHPTKAVADNLYKSDSDELPAVKGDARNKGKKYDFVMMTYSQAQGAKTAAAQRKLDWLKLYAKDAIVICDESHNASGDSNRGKYFQDIVRNAQGVTFSSATFAKRPDNMILYALRSSIGDVQMTQEDLVKAIQQYGIPMQEILAASLFRTGEMVRRERDFSDVKTHWYEPKEIYPEKEFEQSRATFDKSIEVVNQIIDFQRSTVDPIIKQKNEDEFKDRNALAEAAIAMGGEGDIYEYTTTPYSGQVSNVAGLMFYSIKAQKAAEMAIEQIKKGEKPVIAVENTLESYLKDIDGDVKTADFAFVLNRGLNTSLKHRLKITHKRYNPDTKQVEVVKEKSSVQELGSVEQYFGEAGNAALESVQASLRAYSEDKSVMPLMLSPIDYIKKRIEEAGYKCGEITGRSLQLVQAPDGTWHTEPFKADKKKAISQFNGGETDALILNTAGSTGISLHASRRFKDQKKRNMIILQPARDPNTEVQIRGRVDRTGQVSRAEYFYITSPIPAEQKIIMMLRQKLASLDANSVGTENVSSNRVNADDMDNKYGDEVARQFLIDHPEINEQLDKSKQIEERKGEYEHREGLLYDLLVGIQRMTCEEQEMILSELQSAYRDQIEYLNQNGINDLATTTMNLEAVTIDSGLFIKGKDNESMSAFAHDTNIERVEVNVINKPLRSSDINARMKKLGALKEDGTIDPEYGGTTYSSAVSFIAQAKAERKAKHKAAEDKLENELREQYPKNELQSDEEYDKAISEMPQLVALKNKNQDDFTKYEAELDRQSREVFKAVKYLKPGMPMLVPLTDEVKDNAPMSYGRFIGFKIPKDGKPKSIKAVFAVKDSRASIEVPIISKADVIQSVIDNTYGSFGFGGTNLRDIGGSSYDSSITEEDRRPARDEWWDKMIPKDTNRQIRYMVTGNILQACGSLGKYKGTITTFTRKDPDTGEITVERGMLLAENFDPENFEVRSAVTKADVWDGYDQIKDSITNIGVRREGNKMIVTFDRKGREKLSNHPIMKDDGFKALIENGEIDPYSRDQLRAYVSEANIEKVLDYLYKNYSFTKGTLFVMPDSTEKVDKIVYTDKPYKEVIDDFEGKYAANEWKIENMIKRAVANYKMDVNNEDLKTKIRELVQLRQAYYRRRYAKDESSRLAWNVIIYDQRIENAKDDKDERDRSFAIREAIKEELAERGVHGNAMHFESGKVPLDTIIKTFNELNKNKENAELAKRIFAIVKRLKLDVVFNEKIHNSVGGQTAGELVEYNWKYMNAEWITDQMKADTILHELVHTVTVYAKRLVDGGYEHLINEDIIDAVQQLDNIYRQIKYNKNFTHKINESGDSYTDYGVQDWFEMMAEAGSNESFRDDLKRTVLGVKLMSGMISFTDVTNRTDYTGKTQTAYEAIKERMDVLLDNFSEHGFTEFFRGTMYGERSYQEYYRRAENIRNPIGRAKAIVKIGEIAKKLGVEFEQDSSLKAKGAFNPKTGKIRINIDAHKDTADLEATLLHEAVAHYGLRKLFGKDWKALRTRLYEQAAPEIKAKVDAIAKKDGLSTEVAMEEYIAQLAEDGRFDAQEETFWQRIVTALKRLLAKIGVNAGYLTDEDFRAMLYASHRNLQTGGALETAARVGVYQALRRSADASHEDNGPEDDGPDNGPDGGAPVSEDEDMLDRDISDLPEDTRDLAVEQETEELYRRSRSSATTQTAAEMYGNKVRTVGSAINEVLVDEYAPVETLMDALATESGVEIKDSERITDRLRESGGRAMYAIRQYDKKFLQPMWSAVGEFRKQTGSSIADTETYIGLKSGLERNTVFAKRDAKKDYENQYNATLDEIRSEEKQRKSDLDKKLKSGAISDVTYQGEMVVLEQEMKAKRDAALSTRDAHFADVDAGTDERFLEYRKKDYSAITAWAGTDNVEDAEQAAADYVNDMETRAGVSATREMWKRINAATKETLRSQYENGILSRQQYRDISGMMEFYVPMRGFSEDTAEDLYNYYLTAQSTAFQPTILSAKGRSTMYEGPLGNIGAMHSSAISQGVKNDAKLSLLDAVRRRPNNTIATVTRAWFVKNGQKDANGKDIYEVAYPQIPEGATLAQRESIIEQFEQDMADAKLRGDAYNAHREVDLHGGVVAFEREAHKNEHIVQVREGGKEYGIIINGNPAAAQAINGVRRGNGSLGAFGVIMRNWTRLLSSMFTTFSIPFWVSNFQRDHGQGLTNAFIRNNPAYVGRYILNRIKAVKLFPYILGEESLDKAIAKGDKVAILYKQYLENGGPMGQNRIEDNEYFERQMKRYLDNSAKQGIVKGAKSALDFIGGVGETIETITRFAVFMTSMESGRPVHESISDAKEISTNFARKGSGRSFSRDELNRMTHANGKKLTTVEKGLVNAFAVGVELCRATIPFFNAAVQGLENKVTNYTEHTAKTLLADSVYLLLGLGMRLVFANAGGDDDKEKYSHTSDYLRRNNILNPLGDGEYAKWALPQEYRVMFAMGDIIGSAIQQDRPVDDLAIDAFDALMQLSPVGAVTDEVVFSPEDKRKAYQTLITNISPGIVAPVLESVFNMDFKGARIYNEGFNDNLRAYPGWTKALPTTGKEYVEAAKFLNEISGGNDVKRGWININPAIVEHLVESYFSGPYQIVVRTPEAIAKAVKGEAKTRDIPLWNRILLDTNDNQRDAYYSNMYYYFKEKNTEAERIHSEYKSRKREGAVADFYKSKDYQYMLVFKKYDKMEKQLRKASKKALEGNDKAKQGEYDARLQEIQYRMAQECLDIYFNRQPGQIGKEE